jgi:hypothetical protein
MAQVHDALLEGNYDPPALKELMTRILFCLFADDTDVWDRGLFQNYLHLNTREDGSDLGSTLNYIFQILNQSESQRPTRLDEDLSSFTYINGDLFATTLPIATWDEAARTALLEACRFDWSAISPSIFGSMFQNVMSPADDVNSGRTTRPSRTYCARSSPCSWTISEQNLSLLPVGLH